MRLLATLPEGSERDRAELEARINLGTALRHSTGHPESEGGSFYARAMELCERLNCPPEYMLVAYGQFQFHAARGEAERAREVAVGVLQASSRRNSPDGRIMGHLLVGGAAMLRGELVEARSHLEQVLLLHPAPPDNPRDAWDAERSNTHPWLCWNVAQTWLGFVTCWLGYPERALGHSSAAVEFSRKLDHVGAILDCLSKRARLFAFMDQVEQVATIADEIITLARDEFPFFAAEATIFQGYVLGCRGDPANAGALIREGSARYRANGRRIWSCFHLALLAEAHRLIGDQTGEARVLADALTEAERAGENWFVADLHRRQGEAYRRSGDLSAAERSFDLALAEARRRRARLWELRAATSLAGLWQAQKKLADAGALLKGVLAQFHEGLETPPFRAARTLLDVCAQRRVIAS